MWRLRSAERCGARAPRPELQRRPLGAASADLERREGDADAAPGRAPQADEALRHPAAGALGPRLSRASTRQAHAARPHRPAGDHRAARGRDGTGDARRRERRARSRRAAASADERRERRGRRRRGRRAPAPPDVEAAPELRRGLERRRDATSPDHDRESRGRHRSLRDPAPTALDRGTLQAVHGRRARRRPVRRLLLGRDRPRSRRQRGRVLLESLRDIRGLQRPAPGRAHLPAHRREGAFGVAALVT